MEVAFNLMRTYKTLFLSVVSPEWFSMEQWVLLDKAREGRTLP
jgi:hypothetical protein